MSAGRNYKTIGEVVDSLSGAYSDLTVSKIRFLEEEGLVAPDRTPGGYRKFSDSDVARLEIILRLQREHFLPLAVIREKLKDLDRGKLPEELRSVTTPVEVVALPLDESFPVPVSRASEELGLPAEFLRELDEYGLVRPSKGADGLEYSRSDVEIAHACWDLKRYGVEPRHLRMFEGFAEKEATLLAQLLMPALRHRTPEARQQLVETLGELTDFLHELKRELLRRALSDEFEDLN